MNTQNRPTSKYCSRCRKSDLTDFSTCRYCGGSYGDPYDNLVGGKSLPINFGLNPLVIVFLVLVIGSPFAVSYLQSNGMGFLASSSRGGIGVRSASMAVPAALLVMVGKQAMDSAQETIVTQTKVLATNGRNYDALMQRGDAYWTQFKGDLAIADFSAAISARPQSPDPLEKRAMIYDSMGKAELAQKDKDAASKLRQWAAK